MKFGWRVWALASVVCFAGCSVALFRSGEADICGKSRVAFGTQMSNRDLVGARASLSEALRTCPSGSVVDLDRDLSNQEELAKAEIAKAVAAAEKAAAEKVLVDDWRSGESVIAFLKAATSEAAAGRWGNMSELLQQAQDALSSVSKTNVTTTKEWIDLDSKTKAFRRKYQPQLAQVEQAAKAFALQEADFAQERGKKPTNSAWDGSIACVERYLKQVLNDPDSYEHVSTTVPSPSGPYWVVSSAYRAKNGFGGLILQRTTFKIQQEQVVSTN